MTPAQKQWIDEATLVQLLRRWRFSESGDPIFQGKAGDYFANRLGQLQAEDPAAWTAASKEVGWDG